MWVKIQYWCIHMHSMLLLCISDALMALLEKVMGVLYCGVACVKFYHALNWCQGLCHPLSCCLWYPGWQLVSSHAPLASSVRQGENGLWHEGGDVLLIFFALVTSHIWLHVVWYHLAKECVSLLDWKILSTIEFFIFFFLSSSDLTSRVKCTCICECSFKDQCHNVLILW